MSCVLSYALFASALKVVCVDVAGVRDFDVGVGVFVICTIVVPVLARFFVLLPWFWSIVHIRECFTSDVSVFKST